MIILFACLVGWLDPTPIEIIKKIRHDLLKPDWAGVNTGMAPCMASQSGLTKVTLIGTLCKSSLLKLKITFSNSL